MISQEGIVQIPGVRDIRQAQRCPTWLPIARRRFVNDGQLGKDIRIDRLGVIRGIDVIEIRDDGIDIELEQTGSVDVHHC